ncbi:2889_t:CDS:2, partial [Dentiscutata heterogama]
MYMKDFVGDMLEIVIEPELESDKRELVQVTHNECHFYANDGQLKIWTRKDEDVLYPNTWDANLHVKHKEAYVLHSVQANRYWKAGHMLKQ